MCQSSALGFAVLEESIIDKGRDKEGDNANLRLGYCICHWLYSVVLFRPHSLLRCGSCSLCARGASAELSGDFQALAPAPSTCLGPTGSPHIR